MSSTPAEGANMKSPASLPEVDYASRGALVAGEEGVFSIPAFHFESGERLRDLKVGYVTHGRLNPDRGNAILLLPGPPTPATAQTATSGLAKPSIRRMTSSLRSTQSAQGLRRNHRTGSGPRSRGTTSGIW